MRRLIITLLLAGWALRGAGALAQSSQVAQQERDVSYSGTGGITLAGTLLIPAHQPGQRLPGAIIVVGSGAVDRNGNAGPQLTSNLYRQIADQLASVGIASLRFDKRGVGASTPPPIDDSLPMTDQVALVDFNAWDNYVGDAAASLDYLQRQPEIDPTRTAMVGHSEGGYFVLEAAVAGKGFQDPPVTLVLLATPSRPYDAMIADQLVAQLAQQGASATDTASLLNQNAAIVSAIKADGTIPDNVPSSLSDVYPPYMGKFYQGGFAVNPRQLAAEFPGPVLVMQGALDSEVSATIDAPALDAALASRPHDDHQTVIIASASHNLKLVAAPDDPGFAGELAPQAATALGSWLGDKLALAPASTTAPPTTATTQLATPSPSMITPEAASPTLLLPATPMATPVASPSVPRATTNPPSLLIIALILVLLLIGLAVLVLARRRRV